MGADNPWRSFLEGIVAAEPADGDLDQDANGAIREPSPELPREAADAREQRLLLAFRALTSEELKTSMVRLLDTLTTRGWAED